EALALFDARTDLVILDIMLPGISGFDVLEKLREISNVPVLFLTARSQEYDKMLGLTIGADDYLTKPFSYVELIARVHALIRRRNVYDRQGAPGDGDWITAGGLALSKSESCIKKRGERIELTETEWKILKLLAEHPGKVFTVADLYEYVWEEPYLVGTENTVMVHIRRIRKKLEDDPQHPKYLKTVWGRGYRFEAGQ
ncbi:MAG: response regulator transcription factor, partial [bacterium]